MQLLTADRLDLLEAQGYGITELTGFEHHSLPLYAHRPLGDKKPGDVVLMARVGNPGSLADGEATYLARKAFHGMFPWLPGAACIKRTFTEVSIGGNSKPVEAGAAEKGCRWCRSRRRGSRQRRRSTVGSAGDDAGNGDVQRSGTRPKPEAPIGSEAGA